MLSDNGQIIVEVPNADDALLTLYECEPFSHFTYWSCHLFLYTAKTLQMLFDQITSKDELYQADSEIPAVQSPARAGKRQARRSSKVAFP